MSHMTHGVVCTLICTLIMFFLTTKVSNPAPGGPMSSQAKLKI